MATNNYFRCGGSYAFFDERDPVSVDEALAVIRKAKTGPKDAIVIWKPSSAVSASAVDGYVGRTPDWVP
jgi:hypothetical protein